MRGYAVAHDAGDNLKRGFKRFHGFTSCPLAVFGQGISAPYFVLLAFLSASRTQLCSRLARARPSRLAIASIRFRSSSRSLRLTTRVGTDFLAVGITTNDTRYCVHSKTRVVVCSCLATSRGAGADVLLQFGRAEGVGNLASRRRSVIRRSAPERDIVPVLAGDGRLESVWAEAICRLAAAVTHAFACRMRFHSELGERSARHSRMVA